MTDPELAQFLLTLPRSSRFQDREAIDGFTHLRTVAPGPEALSLAAGMIERGELSEHTVACLIAEIWGENEAVVLLDSLWVAACLVAEHVLEEASATYWCESLVDAVNGLADVPPEVPFETLEELEFRWANDLFETPRADTPAELQRIDTEEKLEWCVAVVRFVLHFEGTDWIESWLRPREQGWPWDLSKAVITDPEMTALLQGRPRDAARIIAHVDETDGNADAPDMAKRVRAALDEAPPASDRGWI